MSSAELQKPKAILFDWDNTLVDSWAIIFDALNFTFEAFGKDLWTMEQTRVRVRKSLRDSFPEVFGDDWKKAADVFYGRFDEIHISQLNPIDGAGDMLAQLADSGIFLGVVSNKRGEYLRKEAVHLGWDVHFSSLVGALDAKQDKPAKDPVELALADYQHKSGPDIWFVGDADIDMECAVNSDLTPVLLRKDIPAQDEFQDYQPVYHFVDCDMLSKMVMNM